MNFSIKVTSRSIYHKVLDFWNLTATYNPEVVTGTESWFSEETSNAEVFRSDYTSFRRDRYARGGGVYM
jgi:hypothetical protein